MSNTFGMYKVELEWAMGDRKFKHATLVLLAESENDAMEAGEHTMRSVGRANLNHIQATYIGEAYVVTIPVTDGPHKGYHDCPNCGEKHCPNCGVEPYAARF